MSPLSYFIKLALYWEPSIIKRGRILTGVTVCAAPRVQLHEALSVRKCNLSIWGLCDASLLMFLSLIDRIEVYIGAEGGGST
jgi:hypothetical protein